MIFASFSVADHASDGSGGAGIPGDSEETKPKYKDTPPVDTSTPCVDESLLKKLDKPLQNIAIFDNLTENYRGFYIRLVAKDDSCEFRNILEQKNLKITYSPEKNLVYLAFTSENIIDKMNEVRSLPFIAYVYPDIVEVPTKSSEKLQIFINLNQNDNISQKPATVGGKNVSVYNQPGELGRTLEHAGVVLHNYDIDLRSYYAEATSQVILEVGRLPFVLFIEPESVGSEASAKMTFIPTAPNNIYVLENITELKEDSANKTETNFREKIVEEKRNETLALQKTARKTSWFSKIISNIIWFLKSILTRD